jgi:hypothetical protein
MEDQESRKVEREQQHKQMIPPKLVQSTRLDQLGRFPQWRQEVTVAPLDPEDLRDQEDRVVLALLSDPVFLHVREYPVAQLGPQYRMAQLDQEGH